MERRTFLYGAGGCAVLLALGGTVKVLDGNGEASDALGDRKNGV